MYKPYGKIGNCFVIQLTQLALAVMCFDNTDYISKYYLSVSLLGRKVSALTEAERSNLNMREN